MKQLLSFTCAALLFTLSFCKKQGNEKNPDTQNVNGSEASIDWQDCAYFTDYDITICFVAADEFRCACDALCKWEGALDATLHVTSPGGIDTTITLRTNSNPAGLHTTETINGRVIHFVGTNISDCADYGDYEKYKVNISVN